MARTAVADQRVTPGVAPATLGDGRATISPGHVVMLVAGVVGVVSSFAALRERQGNTQVLVAVQTRSAPVTWSRPPTSAPKPSR